MNPSLRSGVRPQHSYSLRSNYWQGTITHHAQCTQ